MESRRSEPRGSTHPRAALDLLRVPLLGRFLHWRHARVSMQLPLLLLAVVLVLHGLFGPKIAPKNLSTLLVWVHYRGLLVAGLLVFGNVLCMGCPLVLPRELARRFFKPVRRFPRQLRSKWIALALLVGVLFAYERYDLWGSPFWTAMLILGLFAGALLVDSLFAGAPFCKYVCPIGQFNFTASTASPFEVRALDPDTCSSCRTKDCIRGRRDEQGEVRQRGCELALYLPRKTGNLDCTFCLDCIHACPHDNVGITSRVPGEELALDPVRSGIGRLTKRRDLTVLAIVFCFGALLNAFGMVAPVYELQSWMAEMLGTKSESVTLGLLFFAALVVEPFVLLGLAGWIALRATRSQTRLVTHVTHFAWSLVPLGFGVWIAHYAFHLLTGLWTFVPVAQNAVAELGFPLLGTPDWGRGGLHESLVRPIELGFLGLGLLGSLGVAFAIAQREFGKRAVRGFLPWAAVLVLTFGTAIWLLTQPMEMRGTFL